MSELLFHYHRVHPATWAYLSSLLTIALFFKFSRFWSIRNLDLILLILLAPGLLIVQEGRSLRESATHDMARANADIARERASEPPTLQLDPRPGGASVEGANAVAAPEGEPAAPANGARSSTSPPVSALLLAEARTKKDRADAVELWGYIWLFSVGGLLVARLLVDPTMVRRPLLEPNLSTGGLTFLGCSLLVFLMANVMTGRVTEDELKIARNADRLFNREPAQKDAAPVGPGFPFIFVLPRITTVPLLAESHPLPPRTGDAGPESAASESAAQQQPEDPNYAAQAIAVKTLAILGQLAVVAGMIVIGYWHFDNIKTGIGTATLYLMLPYTAQMTGYVEHAVPAAFMIWAVAFYRRPLVAGILMGLAMGMVYYPLYLLPLWLSFYWERGLVRFTSGVAGVLGLLVVGLFFTSADWGEFGQQVQQMFGLWWPRDSGLVGAWGLGWAPVYRIPVLAAFVALAGTLAVWPAQKNLGTLMSCSAAVMLGTQFWHGFGGGLFMAWYLPLALMTIFRPNLEDRVAQVVLGEGWFPKRREPVEALDQAA